MNQSIPSADLLENLPIRQSTKRSNDWWIKFSL